MTTKRVGTLKEIYLLPDLAIGTVIILIAFLFGIMGAFGDSIRRDELTTLGHVGGLEDMPSGLTLSQTVESLQTYSQQHPPLFYVMLNIWGKITTFDAPILRIFALFWGMIALALLHRFANDLGGRHVAWVATILMATSITYLFYTHEIRQYTMLLVWNTLIFLLYTRLHKQKDTPKLSQLPLLTIATIGAIYTHNTSIFLLLCIGIYHLIFVPKTKVWWMISIAVASAGVFYLPWLPTAISGFQVIETELTIDDSSLLYNSDLIQLVPIFWGNGQSVLFLILSSLGLVAAWQNRKHSRYVLFFCIMVAIVVLTMNHYLEFVKRLRYLIISLVPFYTLGAIGLLNVVRWRSLTAIFLLSWVISGTWFLGQDDYYKHTGLDGAFNHPEYVALMPLLNELLSSDEILILVTNDYEAIQPSKQGKKSIEQYYFDNTDISMIRLNSFPGAGEVNLDDIVSATAGRKIWVTYRNTSSPEQVEFLDHITPYYQLCQQLVYGRSSYLKYYVPNEISDEKCQ